MSTVKRASGHGDISKTQNASTTKQTWGNGANRHLQVASFVLGDITDSQARDISALLGECKWATVFHSLEWNRVLSTEFSLEPVVSIVRTGRRDVGYNIYYCRRGLFSLKTSWSPPRMYEAVYGGPVFLDGLQDAARILLEEQERRSGAHTTYVVTPPGFDSTLLRWAGYSTVTAETVVLDTGCSEDDLWRALGAKRRNMIRRAEREGVDVRAGTDAEVVRYHGLLRETLARSQTETLPLSLFHRVVRELVPAGMASFLVATWKHELVAAAFLLHSGRTSWYWSGASSVDGRRVAANDLVQWRSILSARQRGSETYDFLGIDPLRLPGISAFKRGFGGRIAEYCSAVKRTPVGQLVRGFSSLRHPKRVLRKLSAERG